MSTMLKNSWTSLIGILLGIAYYLQGNGAKMPETRAEWWSFGIGLMLAALGVVAKDATTGSKPGANGSTLVVGKDGTVIGSTVPPRGVGVITGTGGLQAPPKGIDLPGGGAGFPLPKAVIALALLYGLGLSACATSTLATSGTALVAVGKEFVAVAQVYEQGCHLGTAYYSTTATIPDAQCRAFRDFGLRFKATYPLAVAVWQAARDASDAAATKRAYDVISQLGAELGALALHGYDTYGGK